MEKDRALTPLALSFALVWMGVAVGAAAGPALLVRLTDRLAWAGAFIALFYVAASAGAAMGGRALDRHGWRAPLAAAPLLAALGFLVAGLGARHSWPLFLLGVVGIAAGFGASNLSRLVATQMVSPGHETRGAAHVQFAALAGAVMGPLWLPVASRLGMPAPVENVWFVMPPILLLASVIVWRMVPARPVEQRAGVPYGGGDVVLPAGVLMFANAAMIAIMGVAGAALDHAGHGGDVLGYVLMSHFLGMFGLSAVVGRIADRVGRGRTAAVGMLLLALAGLGITGDPGPTGLALLLFVTGLGWSFAYLPATVLVAAASPPARRGSILGRVDLLTAALAAIVSLSAGAWYAREGMVGLGWLAAALAVLPVLLLLRPRPRQQTL